MFNDFHFQGTFFLVMSWVTDWPPRQSAAAAGHEIAGHTVTHVRLGGLSDTDGIYQYSVSQATINAEIPGNQCLTIADPNCRSGTGSLCARYYTAGRRAIRPRDRSRPEGRGRRRGKRQVRNRGEREPPITLM